MIEKRFLKCQVVYFAEKSLCFFSTENFCATMCFCKVANNCCARCETLCLNHNATSVRSRSMMFANTRNVLFCRVLRTLHAINVYEPNKRVRSKGKHEPSCRKKQINGARRPQKGIDECRTYQIQVRVQAVFLQKDVASSAAARTNTRKFSLLNFEKLLARIAYPSTLSKFTTFGEPWPVAFETSSSRKSQ